MFEMSDNTDNIDVMDVVSSASPIGQEQNLSITVPKEYTDRDVIFKINKKRTDEPKIHKFRSFQIPLSGNEIIIGKKKIHVLYLFNILREHGLSETLPIKVSLGPLKFENFDWQPSGYKGPTVWYFTWNDVMCSITGITSNGFGSVSLYIRVHDLHVGIGETIINEITDELLKYWKDSIPNKSLVIYTTQQTIQGYRWIQFSTRLQRDISTIYIDKDHKAKLINQLKKFYASSDMYDKYGITWKRVHLFHGPPGSGKTSTILALASLFEKNISKLTITPHLNSQDIELLFSTVQDNSFLLLEDVDSLFVKREATTSIDFSTLLNCMDGITTKRGLVLFMTTNHIVKLDSAFIRPGRVDYVLEFKLPGREELHEALKVLGANYEHEHEEFLNKCDPSLTVAGLQKHLFECIIEDKESILY
jgi:hypothetical protein